MGVEPGEAWSQKMSYPLYPSGYLSDSLPYFRQEEKKCYWKVKFIL